MEMGGNVVHEVTIVSDSPVDLSYLFVWNDIFNNPHKVTVLSKQTRTIKLPGIFDRVLIFLPTGEKLCELSDNTVSGNNYYISMDRNENLSYISLIYRHSRESITVNNQSNKTVKVLRQNKVEDIAPRDYKYITNYIDIATHKDTTIGIKKVIVNRQEKNEYYADGICFRIPEVTHLLITNEH